MEKIKLYSIYTDENKCLRGIFLQSIKDEWEIDINYFGKAGEGEGNFGTPGWYAILSKKIEFLIAKIRGNWGKIIIWSDIDIQFFNKCSDLINREIIDKDIVFLSEHWPERKVNTGFIVMRCNPKTLSLFETVLQAKIESLPYADQSAINDILINNDIGIKWGILPKQFWAMSHGGLPPQDIVLHHATCTMPYMRNGRLLGSIELKVEQLEEIRKYVTSHKLGKWLFRIRRALKRFTHAYS